MYIFNICDNSDVMSAMRIIRIIITIIRIAAPILLIISIMLSYASAVKDNDPDALNKANKNVVPKIVAALLVFFIPSFVNTIANTVSYNSNSYLKCIKYTTLEDINEINLRDAQHYASLAKSKLDRNNYNIAVKYANKLTNKDDKSRMLRELDNILKLIEAEEKKKSESVSAPENGWWFPIGSKKTTTIDGKVFAKGNPSSTWITARFGGNDKVHRNLGSSHGAIDIGASAFENVIASKSGVVVEPTKNGRINYPNQFIKKDPSTGKYNCSGLKSNTVVIDHGNGYTTTYKHLYPNTINVRKGDRVKQGQVIGQVGSSGCSTGWHLHFEIAIKGSKVDPEKYVSAKNPRP